MLFSDDKKLDEETSAKAIQHCQDIFLVLLNEGEESRDDLWTQLSDCAAIRNKEAAEMAWSFIIENLLAIQSDEQLSNCIKACIERLTRAISEEQTWGSIDHQL